MEEIDGLPYIDDVEIFSAELRRLYQERITQKSASKKTRRKISVEQRKEVFQKTLGYCHICGQKLNENFFQIDHLFPHSLGGTCEIDNFTPVCSLCNNYRWNYLPDEIKWIMKVGVWAKTQIEQETKIGKSIAQEFIEYERNRENRRKTKREPLVLEKNKFPIRKQQDYIKLQQYEKQRVVHNKIDSSDKN